MGDSVQKWLAISSGIALACMVCISTLIPSNTMAWEKDLECTAGNCDGWEGKFDGMLNYRSPVPFYFYNKTGKDAFNILITVNFYNFFGEYISRVEISHKGPIHERLGQVIHPPDNAETATFEVYWKDSYGG